MAKKSWLENPLEQEERENKLISFSERWEEELKEKLFNFDKENNQESHTIIQEPYEWHNPHPDQEWDVPITEDIKYFDPELSYELTGYRPITMEKGLDFEPDLFRERAITYERKHNYTEYPAGTKPYSDFWNEEYKRCQEGLTIGKYRITGDHYFFLNYYRMFTVLEDSTAGSGRLENFPSFLSKQYEFFHYVEMAEKLGKDICILKARGIGLSEIVASLAVRPYTTNRGYHVMLTCASETKLIPLKNKCWKQLDWLNMNTNGGFRHVRLVVNNNDTKRASIKTPDGIEYGWGSEITSVVADTSDKIRGDRLDRLIYEEAGSNKYLTESWIKGDALVALGGKHFGSRIALGTGGDDIALNGLSNMFAKPEAYNILPFKNYDTDDGKPELVSFFIPAHKFALTSEYLDKRGVTNYIEFKKFYIAQREKLTDKDFLNECAEHCFTPREALSKHGDNIFDSVVISERMIQIKVHGDYTKPKPMVLFWDNSVAGVKKVRAVEHADSKLLIVEPPILDEQGQPFKNLYIAGIDAIDMGKAESATDYDVSDFCVVIKKRQFGQNPPKYVAIYKDRPNNIREAFEITMRLLVWYNCKALLEQTKFSIQTYFKEHNMGHLFMSRPKVALSGGIRNPKKQLMGLQATPAMIQHGLELIQNFLNDYWYTIDFEGMLDELLNYSYENKRKFDMIAAMICAEIGDEDMTGLNPTILNTIKNQWRDIGYYIDENGYRRRGVIPNDRNWKSN